MALSFEFFVAFTARKWEILFSMAIYRKCETRARVFSQTLAHGNTKNEIRQTNKGSGEEEKSDRIWKDVELTRKKNPDGLAVALAFRPPARGCHSPK